MSGLEAYLTSLVEESMLFALTVSQVFQSLGVTGIVTIVVLAKLAFIAWFCFRFMPNNSVGVVECNNFQDARAFLTLGQTASLSKADERKLQDKQGCLSHEGQGGQRGRQLAILREGAYAINPALFIVITEDAIYALRALLSVHEANSLKSWQDDLKAVGGFRPIVVGGALQAVDPLHPENNHLVDSIGIVTIHDGSSLMPG